MFEIITFRSKDFLGLSCTQHQKIVDEKAIVWLSFHEKKPKSTKSYGLTVCFNWSVCSWYNESLFFLWNIVCAMYLFAKAIRSKQRCQNNVHKKLCIQILSFAINFALSPRPFFQFKKNSCREINPFLVFIKFSGFYRNKKWMIRIKVSNTDKK